ncbi:DUF4153 domain-containing protein [Clostridium sp.]|uniref:DUF4153 domain-containing protein n=1 Tax=Clostridium sp. TaxID=1506 RepID=UPI003F4C894F
MDKRYVQAIILKDNMVLMAHGYKGNKEPINIFMIDEIKENESATNVIEREITDQLNVPFKIIFKLDKEVSSDIETYFISLEDENRDLDFSLKENKKTVGNYYIEGLRWISLSESEQFNKSIINYLILLVKQCIESEYNEDCLDAVEKLVVAYPSFKYEGMKLLKKKRIKEIKIIDSKIKMREKICTIGFALVLSIIYERFFIGNSFGVSVPIFYIMFMGFFFWSTREETKFKENVGFITIIPTFLIAVNYGVHSNSILNLFNGIMLILLITVSTVLIRYENIKWDSSNLIRSVINRGSIAILENVCKPFMFIKRNIVVRNKKGISSINKNILRGILISIPLLVIILVLLTSSDMVFKRYVTNFSSIFENISIGEIINRSVIIIIAFTIIFSYIWSFKYSYYESTNKNTMMKWEPVTMLTIIFMINVVYLLFSIIQFSYLYGGANNFIAGDLTYSEYARKGFFELVAVTIINFTILISTMKFIKKDNKTVNTICNIFLTTLVAFTLNMLFSAHYKMSLYEQTFGFTYLRIFVHLFMLMLFILFIVALIGIWNREMSLNKILIVIVLSMFVILNYINVDKIIAKENIDIYYKTQKIDVQYLRDLSYDAIPEILKLKDDPNASIARGINSYLDEVKKDLAEENSWYEFNYSKYKARKILDQN